MAYSSGVSMTEPTTRIDISNPEEEAAFQALEKKLAEQDKERRKQKEEERLDDRLTAQMEGRE